jgi:hypothetical protein
MQHILRMPKNRMPQKPFDHHPKDEEGGLAPKRCKDQLVKHEGRNGSKGVKPAANDELKICQMAINFNMMGVHPACVFTMLVIL